MAVKIVHRTLAQQVRFGTAQSARRYIEEHCDRGQWVVVPVIEGQVRAPHRGMPCAP